MFRGITNASIDEKGRLSLPQRNRESLLASSDGRLVVTIDTQERCLLVYPLNEWDEVQRRLENLSNISRNTRILQRLLIGHASDLEIDKTGRILLSSNLREYAFLEKKVVLVGQGNKLEAWSEEIWRARMEIWLDFKDRDLELDSEILGSVMI